MNLELNENQKNIAKSIINIGLKKAAESLSFFMKYNIKIEGNDFNIIDIKQAKTNSSNETKKILTTELVGELKGVSYLIFTDNEASQLYKQCLPADVLNNETKLAMMGEAILLEVDNIITASVVTQFSNLLKVKIYGGVPNFSIMSDAQLLDIIEKKSNENTYLLNLKAKFVSEEANFSPEFLWLLDNQFIESIKNFENNEEQVNKLKQLTA
ncbi:MAG: chemotaxis protein CheC [Bacteroidota bacterium]